MIADLLLRWIVTALFVISAVECGFAIAIGRRPWAHTVGRLLHLVMAIAMAVMAWPRGAELPTAGPMWFFLAATLWFVGMALVESGHRGADAYHAAMMLAMSWMYLAMSGSLLPVPADGHSGGGGGHAGHHTSAMPGMPGMAERTVQTPDPPFIGALNWFCTVGFVVAALWWLYRYFRVRSSDPSTVAHRHFGIACQAMMAAGMAIMFGVML
ncbi:hypothetical protein Mycch_1883 [Mycolicibacterium chubuense NBB4]|uniref:DUF5134 domain-containing protein n=1 Tax=Mycolicibacterium chubuense (strain NBB4) TaxID=710421 RepID=I4BHB2_MYCCN|nr:DUF5134 domain-containing protein [Mycolicibacterium chubuense]AFM16669.1 hypothetical protein Mycch_1883 [Mycolicibacterium chubuense NBB4]